MDIVRAILRKGGIEDYELDARLLVCAALQVSHVELLLKAHCPASPANLARLEQFTRRRLAREPVTRILGARGFWSLELAVHPEVLDPRPDTEALIEACLEALGSRVSEPISILDVGTGSGAIIAALLAECPLARGWAIDLSPKAAAVATENLGRLGLADRATVLCQSWSEPLPVRFDLVASNPPYIASGEIARLDPEVREFDPVLALDGGSDGLDAYRSLAIHHVAWLKDGGLLGLEIGADQALAVQAIFEAAGAELVALRQDYGGRDRALIWRTHSVSQL